MDDQPKSEHIGRGLKGKRVLVVEDNADLQVLLLKLLGSVGVSTHISNNGREAIDAIKDNEFDLVLMDIQLPIINGYEATAAIRAQGKNIPIIAITAHAMEEERSKCLEAGCDDYLAKPIARKDLLSMLHRWIDQRAARLSTANRAAQPDALEPVAG